MPFYEKRRVQIYSEEVGCGLLLLFPGAPWVRRAIGSGRIDYGSCQVIRLSDAV